MNKMNTPETTWGPITLPLKAENTVTYFKLWYFTFGTKRWVAALAGDVQDGMPVPLRIESACLFGHVLNSQQCDCGFQLDEAFRRISDLGTGIVIYGVDDDARGLGVEAHFRIYHYRQREQLDTPEVYKRLEAPLDNRDYQPVAYILRHLGIKDVLLLSNNRDRKAFLTEQGFNVTFEALEAPITQYNMATLMLEKEDLGYTWSFRTHGEWLTRLQNIAVSSPDRQSASLVRDTHELVAEVSTTEWDLAETLVAAVGQTFDPSTRHVLYLSDFPRLDELATYKRLGSLFIVLPFAVIPQWLQNAAREHGMKAQDWGRANRYTVDRPQWEPVGQREGAVLYRRGEDFRLVHPGDEGARATWYPATGQEAA
jgi:GTP cyclohydrolase II